MKTLFLILSIVILFVTANARAAECEDEGWVYSLPGLTSYQTQYIYRGDYDNGCSCPVISDGSYCCTSECITGGSIDIPG